MSTFEVPHLDRDPRTGQLLPGHSVSNKSMKTIAHKLAELRSAFMNCSSPEEVAVVHSEHMKCITQNNDWKLKLAAIHEWYDRMLGKAVETLNVSTTETRSMPVLNVTPEQAKILADVIKANPLE